MKRLQRRLRFRLVATHTLVALSGAGTFLGAAAILVLVLPVPQPLSPAEVAPRLLAVVAASAAAGLAVSGLAALAASNWLFAGIAAPVRRMTKMVHRVSRGNYAERVSPGEAALTGGTGATLSAGGAGGAGGARGADNAGRAIAVRDMDDVIGGLAAALDELASALQAADHRRTVSFGEVAHEIRTPVAVLEGYLEGLLDGHVKPSDKTWAMLYDEASRVHRLVDELQALSRAESRHTPPDMQAVDPAALAHGALERLHLHFKEKGLQVNADIAPDLPLVLADPDQALQALINLLTNSLRYTPAPGQVTLSVSRIEGANEVVFRVKDTGVGIAAEHIPHLFERFFRIDRSGNRKVGGSGIGLPVAKALVEAMGGRIWAESEGLGKGSTFSFTLLLSGSRLFS